MGLVSLFCLQANETFEILPYLFNSESAREKVPVIDFGSDTAVDSADENINAFIVDDIKKKRKISRGHRLFSNKKTVIDLTELENGSIDSDMVKQVTLSLQKLCNKNPSYRKGFLMIDLTDGTTKIVEDCLVPNENKLSHGALDRTELQCTVDETESTNSKLVTDLERKILEEFEWEEEDFNADNVVDDVDGCEGIVEGVNSDARGRDGSGEGGDVGSVEKSGEVEGVNSDARGRDGSGEGGEVGSVEKSGEVEGVNSDARGRDGSGEGGDVGSVEKSGEVEGVNSDARGRDVSGECGEVGSVEKSGEVEGFNSDARGRDGSGEGGDVGSVEKSGEVEGVNSDARGRDGSGEGGDVGSVEKSGEVEGVNSDARGRDGSSEGGDVGSVEKSGEVEGVNSDARGRDGSGEGGEVGSVEKSGEVEGVNSDARGRDVSGEDLENSESAYNVCIIPSLVLRMSILNDFYFKPGSWFGQLEAVQEDYIRLTNRTKNFCCINVLLQVFFRINVLRNLLLGISHLPYVVHDQESLEFIQKITNMYTAVKCVGEEPDFYIEAVNTCYASTFYSMALFQTPTRGNRSRTNAQRIAASVSRGGNHQDSNEILLSLVHILDNVYKYQNINFDIDSSLGYQLTSVVQPDIGINLSLKDIVLNYYLSERISFGIRPCSELFAILLLHKDCCSSCGKISLFCSTVEELVIDLPHYDSSSKVFKCEFKYAIRNHSFFIPDIISKNCSSCSPSNSIQHERAVRIVRAPSILVRLNI